MAIIPIDKVAHSDKGWEPFENMNFAKEIPIVPVTVSEFTRVALSMPIILIRVEHNYYFATIMSIENDKNLYVTDEGKWTGDYIPAFLRAYPFSLKINKDGKCILCMEEKFILKPNSSKFEPFFTEGEVSKKLGSLFTFLQRKEDDRRRTDAMCELLQKFNVIDPAKISINLNSDTRTLDGYYQINEKKLNSLGDKEFLEIRKTGLLPSCYLHLHSLAHWRHLGSLHEGRRFSEKAMKTLGDQIFNLSSEGELNFDAL